MNAGLPIVVTDIRPGFVDTAMAKGEGLFWVASPHKAARQIYRAIERKAKHACVTRRCSHGCSGLYQTSFLPECRPS